MPPAPIPPAPPGPVRALVFAGGGARGAYEAGVLGYLLDELPRRAGRAPDFQVLLGTSVGAVHACYAAAVAGSGPGPGAQLRDHWFRLHLDEFVRGSGPERVGLTRRVARALRSRGGGNAHGGWLDTGSMRDVVEKLIPWELLARNVATGRVRAVGVATTELATGQTVIFVEGGPIEHDRWAHDPTVVARPASLGPDHALASAALPVLFPAVRIDGRWHVDGGVRLNTPLAPAIHLGASQLLVITPRCSPALRAEARPDAAAAAGCAVPTPEGADGPPGPVAVLGRVGSALLLDHLDTDLGRMHFVNAILERGERAFGPDFIERLNGAGPSARQLRRVEECVLRPSRDPARIAREVLETAGPELSRPARLLLDSLGAGDPEQESTLMSFLLFHSAYAEALLDLGRADARDREDELARFLGLG